MKKAVIFDMDGTLLDTLPDLARSCNYALASLGYPARTTDEVRRFIGNGAINLMRRAVPADAGEAAARRALDIFRAHYDAHSEVDTRPYPGVSELLAALHRDGWLTAIVSNKFDSAVKELNRRWFGVHVAVGESDRLRRKPAPDMVDAALAELGCTAAEAVYVGDTDVDYHTAVNSGCTPVLVSWGYRPRAELEAMGGGCAIAAGPDELMAALNRLR